MTRWNHRISGPSRFSKSNHSKSWWDPLSASKAGPYFDSLMIASAALPAKIQLADPATTASSSNQRNP